MGLKTSLIWKMILAIQLRSNDIVLLEDATHSILGRIYETLEFTTSNSICNLLMLLFIVQLMGNTKYFWRRQKIEEFMEF